MKLYLIVKRIFDILVSVVGIVALSPVLLLTYLAIKLDSPGPAIFKQKKIRKVWKGIYRL